MQLVQFRMLQPELLVHRRPIQLALFAQAGQEPVQIDLHRSGAFGNKGIVLIRLSQSLSDIRPASAHAPQKNAESFPAAGVLLEQVTQLLFCSSGQLQLQITSAIDFQRDEA